jgi:hypothetical protein
MELVISKVIRNEKTYVFMLAHILAIETFSQTYSNPFSRSETYSIKDSYSGRTSRYTITKELNGYERAKLYSVDYSKIYRDNYRPSGSQNAQNFNWVEWATTGIEIHNKQKSYIGVKDLDNGLHAAHFVGNNYYEKPSSVQAKCLKMVQAEAHRLGHGEYRIVNEIHEDRSYPYVLAKTTIFFHIMDENGEIILSESDKKKLQEEKLAEKSSARQELLELKELFDMGIISQEEFDTKAKTLKIIVLAPSAADEQHTVLSEKLAPSAADEQHTVLSEKNAEGDFISENGFLKYDGRNFQDNSKGSLRLIIQLGKKYYTASFVGNSPDSDGFVILEDWLEYDEGSKRWAERNDSKTKIPKAAIKGFKYL